MKIPSVAPDWPVGVFTGQAGVIPFPVQLGPEFPGYSAGRPADEILAPLAAPVPYVGAPGYGAARSKAIRDLFRSLGWGKWFRVTKGGYSLGTSITWSPAARALLAWCCAEHDAKRTAGYAPACLCATCQRRRDQAEAIARRVAYVLNAAFVAPGERAFGDRSDLMTDYFEADYTFHPYYG